MALATLQRLAIVPGVAARAQAKSGEARRYRTQRQASFDPSGILLYTPEYVEGEFSEVHILGVLRTSPLRSSEKVVPRRSGCLAYIWPLAHKSHRTTFSAFEKVGWALWYHT